MLAYHQRSAGQVPMEFSVQRRVVEGGERAIDLPDRPTQIGEERFAVPDRRAKGPALQPGNDAHIIPLESRNLLAGQRPHDGRYQLCRGQMRHHRVLRLDQAAILGGVGDLEHEARAFRQLEAKVLIALARQRFGHHGETEEIARDPLGGVGRQTG